MLKVLILAPAPPHISSSQRFRFEHYIYLNEEKEITFIYRSFFSQKGWALLHKKGHHLAKTVYVLEGFMKRFFTVLTAPGYDFVFVQREAAPIGPPVFEWILKKIFNKKIIYDFDDSIWVNIASEANPVARWLKSTWKVPYICKLSKTVSVGNEYLAGFARRHCPDVRIIPTVVDTQKMHNTLKKPSASNNNLTIGWTGTFTNFSQLKLVTGAITELRKKNRVNFLIIADKDPNFNDVDYAYLPWKKESEINDLLKIDIGIMPLHSTEIELGKCGFKAIQYMSLGIPAVVSPVGANKVVVSDGINGFWASTAEEWFHKLNLLLNDADLRAEMGRRARAHIVENFSVTATKNLFFSLFKNQD